MVKLLLRYPEQLDRLILAYMQKRNIKSKTQAIISILTERLSD